MSKLLIVLSLIFSSSLALAYDIDLTGGRAEIEGTNAITVHNVKFGGISAVWARLVWNPELNAFKLVEFGDDSGRNHDTSLSGRWNLTFDWACDGTTAVSSWTLNEDGTCSDAFGNSCQWSYINSQFSLDYGRRVGALYSGSVDRVTNELRGTMNYEGVTGCWSAYRVVVPPQDRKKQDVSKPNRPKASDKKGETSSPLKP